MTHRIAAAIVLYRPDPDIVSRLIGAVAPDVACVLLFCNSRIAPALMARCTAAAGATPLEVLDPGANLGLGHAYNALAQTARQRGCDRLLLFDQDSEPQPGMPARLAAAFARASIEDRGEGAAAPVAAIGPKPVDPETREGEAAAETEAPAAEPHRGLADVAFLISSGSLIELDALDRVGPFREDFFIDAIDIEWCFRARARGYRCVMALSEAMPHRLGRGFLPIPLLRLRFIEQPPLRLFTFARNQVAMMRLAHVPPWWKLRVAGSLLLRLTISASRFRGRETAAVVGGMWSGLRGRLGPPPHVPREGDR